MSISAQHKEYVFGFLLLGFGALTAYLFLPFLSWLILALVLAVTFNPIHQWLFKKLFRTQKPTPLTSTLTLIVIALTVVIPMAIVISSVYSEILSLSQFLTTDAAQDSMRSFWNQSFNHLTSILPKHTLESFNFTNILSEIVQKMVPRLTQIFSNLTQLLIGIFVSLLALYYFLYKGSDILQSTLSISPLNETDNKNLVLKTKEAIYSIFRGLILVAIIQGAITGIGFALFGLPSPFLWGFVATIAALVPALGTGLIIGPGVLHLYLTGSLYSAIGLLLWGLIPVGMSDNILRPLLMAQHMKVHPFLILLSVLGGIALFGIAGLLYGPLIIAIFCALMEIYQNSKK